MTQPQTPARNRHYDEIMQELGQQRPYWNLRFASDYGQMREFLAGTLEAIAFTDGTHEGQDELAGLDLTVEGPGGWGDGEILKMLEEADKLLTALWQTVRDCIGFADLYRDDLRATYSALAYDVWLTRNGHGTGLWDREWTYMSMTGEGEAEGLGAALTALVGHGTEFPARDAYRGDDGRAYLG